MSRSKICTTFFKHEVYTLYVYGFETILNWSVQGNTAHMETHTFVPPNSLSLLGNRWRRFSTSLSSRRYVTSRLNVAARSGIEASVASCQAVGPEWNPERELEPEDC